MTGLKSPPCQLSQLYYYGNSSADVYGKYVGYYNGYYWFNN